MSDTTIVSITKCAEYDPALLKRAISDGLREAGIDLAVLSGLRVALKPNLLTSSGSAKGVTTHPLFFRAAAELVLDHGGRCVVIESPSIQSVGAVMKKAGYADIVRELGLEVADDTERAAFHWDGAARYKSVDVIRRLLDVDAVVNLPKCKTHGLTYFTGAVKNLFGLMPGKLKAGMHLKAPGVRDFAGFLLDFYGALLKGFEIPRRFLHIMDAVTGIEGEGPGPTGSPVHIGAILAGTDALAVDLAAVRLTGLDEEKTPTLKYGYARRLGITEPAGLEIRGDGAGLIGTMKIREAKGSFFARSVRWPRALHAVKNLLVEKPVPMEGPCTLCYQCKSICPAGAISPRVSGKKVPVYDYGLCIRCFCCMEVCPEAAIVKKSGLL